MRLPWLDPRDDGQPFPPADRALAEPDGLLAAGGSLSPCRLLRAYRQGIFPWYSPGQPILWWSPDPRLVLFPESINLSRSLRKTLKKGWFTVTADTAFAAVIAACAGPRAGRETGTWITPEMNRAYCRLHRLGHAHSIETWREGELVGGLYGVAVGQVFFGESMFTRISFGSQIALAVLGERLRQRNYKLFDAQMRTPHIAHFGAIDLTHNEYLALLTEAMLEDRKFVD